MLKRNLDIYFSFSKSEALSDPAIQSWIIGLTSGAIAKKPSWDCAYPDPENELTLDCINNIDQLLVKSTAKTSQTVDINGCSNSTVVFDVKKQSNGPLLNQLSSGNSTNTWEDYLMKYSPSYNAIVGNKV